MMSGAYDRRARCFCASARHGRRVVDLEDVKAGVEQHTLLAERVAILVVDVGVEDQHAAGCEHAARLGERARRIACPRVVLERLRLGIASPSAALARSGARGEE